MFACCARQADGAPAPIATTSPAPPIWRAGALPRQNHVGEYQGLAAIGRRGFAAIFTLAAPFATDGPTDIFVAQITRRGCRHHERCWHGRDR